MVEDDIRPPGRSQGRVRIPDIPPDPLDFPQNRCEILRPPGGEVIEDPDGFSPLHQPQDHMRADEASPPGHKIAHDLGPERMGA